MVYTGLIIMWSGHIVDIPRNWVLCNGQNGTPNMLEKFVVPTVSDSKVCMGAGTPHMRTLSSSNIPNHTHNHSGSIASGGISHQHSMPLGSAAYEGQYISKWGDGNAASTSNTYTDYGGQHLHSCTSNSAGGLAIDFRPPYYKLAFLMYIGD